MKKPSLGLTLSLLLALSACSSALDISTIGQDGPEPIGDITESAMASVGEAAAATEGQVSPNLTAQLRSEAQLKINLADGITNGFNLCTYAGARGGCGGATTMFTAWGPCNVGVSGYVLSGTWIENFSTPAACVAVYNGGATPGVLPTGQVTNRTTGKLALVYPTGASVLTDTLLGTPVIAYDGVTINANGITISETDVNSNTRNLTIDSVHKTYRSMHGTAWFDHFLIANTTTPGATSITLSGSRAAGTRTATGTMIVYHNIAQYKAVETFNNVKWGNANCCYPTSGTITATTTSLVNGVATPFPAGSSGTVTMDFSPGASNCGFATFTDQSGNSQSNYQLSMCQ